jgi:hypothetical protein
MADRHIDVQRLLDRAAIHDLLACYFQGIDAANPEQVRGCFTEDVRAAYDGRTFVDGIEALMGAFLAFKNKASGEWKATTHFMGNLSFGSLDGDSAETETYAIAFLVTPSAAGDRLTMRSLRYLDRLRKTDAGWRICDRIHTLDWSCEVPASSAGAMAHRLTATLPART